MRLRLAIAGAVAFALFPSAALSQDKLRDVIDARLVAAWKEKGITPAEPASDAEFLRRVYVDLHGQIPTASQARAFLDDQDPAKREKLIDKLLSEPRFAVHQADIWDMVYFGRNPPGYNTDKREGFHHWLQKQFRENVPYNVWAAELLRAEGNSVEQGPPLYYVQYRNQPEDLAEAVSRQFLGVQVQCARCHDHPFEDWTQLDFYGFAAFFARLEVVELGQKEIGDQKLPAFALGEKNKGDIQFTGPVTEDEPGKKGTPVKPKFLAGDPLDEPEPPADLEEPRNFPNNQTPPKPQFSRRDALVDWMTQPENPYFARAAANRVWAQFMGKGVVHPVDNLSETNPPSLPQLLDDLEQALVNHNFDLKWFIGEICKSKAYQLSSGTVGDIEITDAAMPTLYERARYRPLSAGELFESWMLATGYDDVLAKQNQQPKRRFDARGITWDYMRRFFGEPNDGEGYFQGGMAEHLFLNNGQVRQMISDNEGGLMHAVLKSESPWEDRVEQMFLQTLSRRPSEAELKKFVEYLNVEEREQRDRCHDAIWTLVTCSEFRFNH